ncbi:MAG: DUF192 domain-containing protein [Bacillota bacterium]|nr:DUF192 domain-containing protein [Bacillota bacterium]MDP4158679.1 DUF192 domain-containing protein [Bacillota bacterium]
MKSGRLRNQRTGQVVGKWVWKADSFWTRFCGLLGRSNLQPGEGLWLLPCQQVHMLGMKFPLSVWFIDQSGQVCALVDELRPWRISPRIHKAVSILEFPKGWGKMTNTQLGDELVWEEHL